MSLVNTKEFLTYMFYTLFLKHPKEKGISYFCHMKHALTNAFYLSFAVLALVIHSIFPIFFETTGSTLVEKVYHNFNLGNKEKDNN